MQTSTPSPISPKGPRDVLYNTTLQGTSAKEPVLEQTSTLAMRSMSDEHDDSSRVSAHHDPAADNDLRATSPGKDQSSTTVVGHALPDGVDARAPVVAPMSGPDLRRQPPQISGRHFKNRELIGLALVAARGASLTAAQIVAWVTESFSQFRKGRGIWERNLKAILSASAEFRGRKILGAKQNKMTYEFTDASVKARYEAEYLDYRDTAHSGEGLESDFMAIVKQEERIQCLLREEDMQEPPNRLHLGFLHVPEPAPLSPKSPEPERRQIDPSFMPFERAVSRTRPRITSEQVVQRKTSSQTILLQNHSFSVESMTGPEKLAKIAEIKARPSRKKFFGSDYRLWHVRRYGRHDIHDESDGAWRPKAASVDTEPKGRTKGQHDSRGQTLREAFDLPEHVIPMNDGQAELAFRDATLVCSLFCQDREKGLY